MPDSGGHAPADDATLEWPRVDPDRYRDFVPLGQGGMGIVYRALDLRLGREVAFKVQRPGGWGSAHVTPRSPLRVPGAEGGDEEGASETGGPRLRFAQEACLTAGLEHPGIAPIYDVGRTDDGLPYYTMRYVPGARTLADALEGATSPSFASRGELFDAFLSVCDAVGYAHARGVVHRDLKPENVALGRFGEVVVLDWGLAALGTDGEPESAAWRRGLLERRAKAGPATQLGLLGTPGYVPPEVLGPATRAAQPRRDVFALGVVLHRILYGRTPWPHDTVEEYVAALAAGEADAPEPRAHDVPAALAALCARALRRDPSDRFADAADLGRALRAWRASSERRREIDALLTEAGAALEAAERMPPAGRDATLELASGACARVRALDSDLPDASALQERVRLLREDSARLREREARRRGVRRVAIVALALAAMGAVVVAVAMDRRRRETEEARSEARAGHARAERVIEFLLFDLRERLEPVGRLDVLGAVAERALRHYQEAPAPAGSTAEQKRRAVALGALGDVLRARGDLPRALEAYVEEERVAKAALGHRPGDPGLMLEAILAAGRRSAVRDAQGHRGEALAGFSAQVKELEALRDSGATVAGIGEALAKARGALARALVRQGDVDTALTQSRRARSEADQARDAAPADERLASVALEAALDEVQALDWTGRHAEAVAAARAVLARLNALRREDPGDLRWLRLAADAWLRLIVPLGRSGDLPAADQAFRQALALFERERDADPADERWRERIAMLRSRMGDVLRTAQRWEELIEIVEPAREDAERLAAADPSSGQRLHLVVDVSDRLATAYWSLDRKEPARAARRRVVEAAEALLARDPDNFVWRQIAGFGARRLGEVLCWPGHFAESRSAYDRAHELLAPIASDGRADVAVRMEAIEALHGGGVVRCLLDERDDGLERMRDTLRRFEVLASGPDASPELGLDLLRKRTSLVLQLDPALAVEREEALALGRVAQADVGRGGAGPIDGVHVVKEARRLETALDPHRRSSSGAPGGAPR